MTKNTHNYSRKKEEEETKLHTLAKAYVQEFQVAMTLEDQSRNLIHKG